MRLGIPTNPQVLYGGAEGSCINQQIDYRYGMNSLMRVITYIIDQFLIETLKSTNCWPNVQKKLIQTQTHKIKQDFESPGIYIYIHVVACSGMVK